MVRIFRGIETLKVAISTIKMNQSSSIDESKNTIVNDVNIVHSVPTSRCRYAYGDCWPKGLPSKRVNLNILGLLTKRHLEVFQLGMPHTATITNYS